MTNPISKKSIEQAIGKAEQNTSGEIRVHLTRHASQNILRDAERAFWKLGMHLTRDRSGILIYVCVKSRTFAILGDEGIHQAVGEAFWNETRDLMQTHFAQGHLEAGIVAGIDNAGRRLVEFFPIKSGDSNELSNKVSEDV